MDRDALAETLDDDLPPRTHNQPPDPIESLLEDLRLGNVTLMARKDELLEAVDRAPEAIEDDVTASKAVDFIKQIGAAITKGEDARKTAKEPFLEGGRAVDGFFKQITDPLQAAKKILNKRLTAFEVKKEAEERRRRQEEERKAREEAERAAREAADRAATLQDEAGLSDALAAEEAARQAEAEAAAARREAEAKPAELSRTRGDYGVSSLRTVWVGELVDRATLDLEALRDHLPQDGLEKGIRSFVKAGGRNLRGASIYEKKEAVTR